MKKKVLKLEYIWQIQWSQFFSRVIKCFWSKKKLNFLNNNLFFELKQVWFFNFINFFLLFAWFFLTTPGRFRFWCWSIIFCKKNQYFACYATFFVFFLFLISRFSYIVLSPESASESNIKKAENWSKCIKNLIKFHSRDNQKNVNLKF